MNRVIKFRGYCDIFKIWLYGFYMKLDDIIYICNSEDFEADGHHINQISDEPLWVVSESVGQFTGLYDKNGTEIYEGDILQVGDSNDFDYLEVRFVRGVFAFLWNGNLDNEFPTQAPTQEWAEVIGNIYENPELLKNRK